MDPKEFKSLLKTTPKFINILAEHGIYEPKDLLWYFPRTYEDRRDIKPLSLLTYDWSVEITKGKVTKKSLIRTPRWKRLATIEFIDEQENKWLIQALNGQYLIRSTKTNTRYYIIWKPQHEWGKVVFRFPELIEALDTKDLAGQVGCIYPVYSDMAGIKSTWFGKKIPSVAQQALHDVVDTYPANFYKKYDLMPLQDMLRTLHYPETIADTTIAKKTVFFKRLLRVQLHSIVQKQLYQWSQEIQKEAIDRELIKQFTSTLPFELTNAQKKSLKQIIENIHEPKAMLRLLQWDVGSWKTVVAAAAARYTIQKFWWQVAFLAPLAVLAQQHHKTLAKLLLPLWISVQLITWATKKAEKEQIKQSLQLGHIQIIVWTHALLQDDVQFHNLQLAVIDEQHKFGVRQRAYLQRHSSPHLLQMTATPIPRSLALAFFGEFEVSTIDEMPPGRKPIHTKIISESEFHKLKPRILTKIEQGQKIFIISPLIEESEAEWFEHIKAVKTLYQEIRSLYDQDIERLKKHTQAEPSKDNRHCEPNEVEAWQSPEHQATSNIGLLHWKLKPSEKDQIMQDFKEGRTNILVSTTVIEVGIDIPDATVMVIYNAERFGLSQLHQLRGRVGRSDMQSYCFLETKKKSGDTYQRLKHLEDTTDGFKLAEIDLQYRGPGEFLWVRQAGESDIPLEILTDTKLLEQVQVATKDLLQDNPDVVKKILQTDELENMLV